MSAIQTKSLISDAILMVGLTLLTTGVCLQSWVWGMIVGGALLSALSIGGYLLQRFAP